MANDRFQSKGLVSQREKEKSYKAITKRTIEANECGQRRTIAKGGTKGKVRGRVRQSERNRFIADASEQFEVQSVAVNFLKCDLTDTGRQAKWMKGGSVLWPVLSNNWASLCALRRRKVVRKGGGIFWAKMEKDGERWWPTAWFVRCQTGRDGWPSCRTGGERWNETRTKRWLDSTDGWMMIAMATNAQSNDDKLQWEWKEYEMNESMNGSDSNSKNCEWR